MNIKSLVCSCALMVGLAGVAQAHENVDNDGKFTLLFGGGQLSTDSKRDLDDGKVGEIGLGYIIDKHWAVEAIYSDISGLGRDTLGGSVDADMYRLDALYHFDKSGHWTPYLAVGAGETSFDTSIKDETDTAFNFGGGIKYALSKELTVRGDVRGIYGNDNYNTDVLATIGFNYIFGASLAAPLDSDGDGVLDVDDRCPGTPAGVVVNSKGCALDSDLDGVPNYLDRCHSTPVNVRVNEVGCPLMTSESVSIDLEILFDLNSADVNPSFMPEIQRVADFVYTHPNATAVVEGHTDNWGEASYNQDLSERRVNAVRDAVRSLLVDKMDLDAIDADERVTAIGYGEDRPRASNDTPEGRQQNRHVTAVISANVDKQIEK